MIVQSASSYRFRVSFNGEVNVLSMNITAIQPVVEYNRDETRDITVTATFRDTIDGKVREALERATHNLTSILIETLEMTGDDVLYNELFDELRVVSIKRLYDYTLNKALVHTVVFSND